MAVEATTGRAVRPLRWAGAAAVAAVTGGLFWRVYSRREALPCPSWLTVLLDNPYMNRVAGAEQVVERLRLEPGMAVLDVGCGPGRLTVPLAERVGPAGRVLALDIQAEMLERARARVVEAGLGNVDFVLGGAGTGLLPESAFDCAVLVTVLGEIPDRGAALAEIYRALRPGGVLSITEALPDPHYQTRRAVARLAGEAGFEPGPAWSLGIAYTAHFVRPQ